MTKTEATTEQMGGRSGPGRVPETLRRARRGVEWVQDGWGSGGAGGGRRRHQGSHETRIELLPDTTVSTTDRGEVGPRPGHWDLGYVASVRPYFTTS